MVYRFCCCYDSFLIRKQIELFRRCVECVWFYCCVGQFHWHYDVPNKWRWSENKRCTGSGLGKGKIIQKFLLQFKRVGFCSNGHFMEYFGFRFTACSKVVYQLHCSFDCSGWCDWWSCWVVVKAFERCYGHLSKAFKRCLMLLFWLLCYSLYTLLLACR